MLDTKVIDKYIRQYPTLELLFQSGVVGMKLSREVLDIDRWLMHDVYKDLLLAGAVRGLASSNYRATDECLAYLQSRSLQLTKADTNENICKQPHDGG